MRTALLAALVVGVLGFRCEPEARRRLDAADELAFRGDHQAAMQEVERALESLRVSDTPEKAHLRREALSSAGRLSHLYLRRPQAALRYYRRLVEEFPDSTDGIQARQRMARIHIDDLGDLPGALAHYQALVAAHPDSPEADRWQYEVVNGYFTLGDWTQTRTEARRFQERYADSEWMDDVLFLVGGAFQGEGSLDEAVRTFRELAGRYGGTPLSARALVEQGNALDALGKHDEAVAAYVEALATHPDPAAVQVRISRLRARVKVRRPAAVDFTH